MEKKVKTKTEIEEEDNKIFQRGNPEEFKYLTSADDVPNFDKKDLIRCAFYVTDRVPEDYITRELLFNLSEIDSVSSLTTISDEELERVGEIDSEDEINKKTLRELFYELVIEKYNDRIKPSFDDEEGLDGDVQQLPDMENVEYDSDEDEDEGVTKETKAKRASIIDTESDEPDKFAVIIDTKLLIDAKWKKFNIEDVIIPEDDLNDTANCKSLKTILEDTLASHSNGEYHINSIICLLKYNNRKLKNDELPIEIEIADTINNFNYNTIKPASGINSLITGCIMVHNGVGILNLEISLFDLIRLIASLNWSFFNQKITEIKILSIVKDVSPKFTAFLMCKVFLNKNDNRRFPKIRVKRKRRIRKKRKFLSKWVEVTCMHKNKNCTKISCLKTVAKKMGYVFKMLDNVPTPNVGELRNRIRKKRNKDILKYLHEISEKLDYTFKILMHQSKLHPCAVIELPPCASEHLPSNKLIMWAIKCNVLKTWKNLMNDILEPSPYYDSTNTSYPAPTSPINFHNLSVLDRDKEFINILYRNGFNPTFTEDKLPALILPGAFSHDAEQVFENIKFKFINVDVNELNYLYEKMEL